MKKTKPMCKKCRSPMGSGIALENTVSGVPDFGGSNEVVTMSRTGPPILVKVWKCPKCGHSIAKT